MSWEVLLMVSSFFHAYFNVTSTFWKLPDFYRFLCVLAHGSGVFGASEIIFLKNYIRTTVMSWETLRIVLPFFTRIFLHL